MATLRLGLFGWFLCAVTASSFTGKGVWVPRTRSRGHYHEMSGTKYSCESKCVSQPRCASVTFEKRSSRGHCYLHQQVSEEANYADASWSQFVKTSSRIVQDQVCFGIHTRGHWLRYKKLTGNDYRKIQAECPMACGVACDKDPKCVGASVPIPVAYTRRRYTTCTLHSSLRSGRFVRLYDTQSAFYVKIEKSTVNQGFWFPSTRIESRNSVPEETQRQCERECIQDPQCAAASMMSSQSRSRSREHANRCYKSRTIRSKTNYNKQSSYMSHLDSWKTFIKTKSSATCSTTHNRGYWFRQLSMSTTTMRTEQTHCYDDCASLCEKTKACKAAVYTPLTKSCELKTSYDDKRVDAQKGCDIYIKLNYDKGSQPEPQPGPENPVPVVKVPAKRNYTFCKTQAAHPYHCPELWLSTEYRIHSQQDCQDICSGRGSCQAYFNDNVKHGKWENHCLLLIGLCMKKEAGEEPVEYFSKSQTQGC